MMNEKRFICGLGFPINSDDPIRIINDTVEDKDYYKFSDICNVLNEQQSEIERLQKIIDITNYQLKVQDRIIQKMEENE